MSADVIRNNLGEWANEPIIQNQVIALMEDRACPVTLREIYLPLGLPRQNVNRVLGRLHGKGVVTRYKIPERRHRYDLRAKAIQPEAATRLCFLYSFSEGYDS